MKPTVVAKHGGAIKAIRTINDLLITGSWDKTVSFWDGKSSKPGITISLGHKVFSLDVEGNMLVVGTAEREVKVFDVRRLLQGNTDPAFQCVPLKFQLRSVRVMPDQKGFLASSISGRVRVEYVGNATSSFSYRCHRDGDNVYSVNNTTFHPNGCFATCGSDGGINFWDKDSKQRLKAFPRHNNTISAAEFNPNGTLLAYAVSYDYTMGAAHTAKTLPNEIYVMKVAPKDIAPRRR